MAENPKRPVRIGIVGASGFIGRAHLQHVLEEKDCVLAALIDTAPSVAAIAKEHNVPYFQGVDEFVNASNTGDLAVDAIILATPTQTHVALAQSLAESGLSLLIEKPLAAAGKDGKFMSELSKQNPKGVYMVGHHRRHSTYVKAVKDVLDKQKLGKIIAVNGVWAMRKSDTYFDIPWHTQVGAGGVTLTNAIHDIDMLQYWLGDITEVFAMEGLKERPYAVDSTVQLMFKFSSGVVGSFLQSDTSASHMSWEAATGDNPVFSPTGEDFLSIFGTKGSISLPSLIRYHYDGKPEAEMNWNYPLQKDMSAQSMVDGIPAFTNQLKHFIAAIRHEVEPNCSVEDGAKAVLVTEAVFESLKTGKPASVELL